MGVTKKLRISGLTSCRVKSKNSTVVSHARFSQKVEWVARLRSRSAEGPGALGSIRSIDYVLNYPKASRELTYSTTRQLMYGKPTLTNLIWRKISKRIRNVFLALPSPTTSTSSTQLVAGAISSYLSSPKIC